MKSAATLTVNSPFLLVPTDSRPTARRTRTVRQQPEAPTTGLFTRLERETAIGGRPETVVFALLALTGVAWPAYEALRVIAGF